MKKLRYLALTLLLTLPLLGMLGRQMYILHTGAELALEIVPVDPRSLFRGDYVRLNYAISTLRTADLGGDNDFSLDDEVYVTLLPEADLFVAKAVFHQRPVESSGQQIIKGRITSIVGQRRNSDKMDATAVPARLSVRYGIESYFVPEGTGRELEKKASLGEVSVLAAVLRSGEAAIKGLRINGDNYYIDPL